MRVTLCKFCEYSCQLANGRHSLIGVFDSFVLPQVPFDHPPFYLSVQVEFEPIEANKALDLVCALIDEDGKELFNVHATGQIPPSQEGHPVKIFIEFMIPGLRFEKPGDYRLDLSMGAQKVAEERLPALLQSATGRG